VYDNVRILEETFSNHIHRFYVRKPTAINEVELVLYHLKRVPTDHSS